MRGNRLDRLQRVDSPSRNLKGCVGLEMKIRDCVAGAMVIGLLGSSAAHAAVYTFNFSGVADDGSPGVIAGDPFTGSVSWDTDTLATYVESSDGISGLTYYPNAVQAFSISGSGITVQSTGMLSIVIVNDTFDLFKVVGPTSTPGANVELYLQDPTGAVFSSMGLPSNISVSDFGFRTASFGVGDVQVYGHVIDPDAPPSAPVPEPATWALMIAGFGLVGLTLRRRSAPSPA